MNTPSREVFRKYTDDQTFDRIIEFGTVSEMWSRCSKEFADAIAITDAQNEYTYAQLDEEKQTIVRKAIPQNISEAEPKDIAKK